MVALYNGLVLAWQPRPHLNQVVEGAESQDDHRTNSINELRQFKISRTLCLCHHGSLQASLCLSPPAWRDETSYAVQVGNLKQLAMAPFCLHLSGSLLLRGHPCDRVKTRNFSNHMPPLSCLPTGANALSRMQNTTPFAARPSRRATSLGPVSCLPRTSGRFPTFPW